MPSVENAGNVMRPYTTVKIGMRLPPDVDAEKASTALEEIITAEPPFNADVKYVPTVASNGWSAKAAAPWITKAFEKASETYWGNKPAYMGLGASIPLVKLFSEKWPHAQFMVSGALGPNSNAHGPNESLHIEYCKKQTASVAYLISQYEEH
jgi:peptidase, family M20/M25/M40